MNNSMCLSFQVKASKKNEFGQAPIYARITINEVRTEFSIKRFIEPEKWINKAGSDADLRWVLVENLKKKRLERADPAWVTRCQTQLK